MTSCLSGYLRIAIGHSIRHCLRYCRNFLLVRVDPSTTNIRKLWYSVRYCLLYCHDFSLVSLQFRQKTYRIQCALKLGSPVFWHQPRRVAQAWWSWFWWSSSTGFEFMILMIMGTTRLNRTSNARYNNGGQMNREYFQKRY